MEIWISVWEGRLTRRILCEKRTAPGFHAFVSDAVPLAHRKCELVKSASCDTRKVCGKRTAPGFRTFVKGGVDYEKTNEYDFGDYDDGDCGCRLR